MSDPAVDAAARAFAQVEDDDLAYASERDKSGFITAAREALAPIRDIHFPRDVYVRHMATGDVVTERACDHCGDGYAEWPCATAKLIYPSEEL